MDDLFPKVVKLEFEKFGTDIGFQIVVKNNDEIEKAYADMAEAEKICERIDGIFNRFKKQSEISFLNDNLKMPHSASAEILEMVRLSINYYEKTDGYFDPRIISKLESIGYDKDFAQVSSFDMTRVAQEISFKKNLKEDLIVSDDCVIFNERMDFNGIVKGFVADHLSAFFKLNGWDDFFVNCGGDMFFSGENINQQPWYIDIEGIDYQKVLLKLCNQGIATSGIGKRKWEIGGQRFHHLINPKEITKQSFDLKSVTVIDDQVSDCDIFAKSLFLMGRQKAMDFSFQNDIACSILDYKGNVWMSEKFKKYLYQKNV